MQANTRTHRHIIMRTCWPVLLRRREMLSNSAFQHSTSDYLFSFTGRFELVMYFPFSVGLASLSLSLSVTRCQSPMPSLSLTPPMPVWLTVDVYSTQHVKYTHSYTVFANVHSYYYCVPGYMQSRLWLFLLPLCNRQLCKLCIYKGWTQRRTLQAWKSNKWRHTFFWRAHFSCTLSGPSVAFSPLRWHQLTSGKCNWLETLNRFSVLLFLWDFFSLLHLKTGSVSSLFFYLWAKSVRAV